MKTYISLLRGINVSGQNRISMPELKRLCESLGLREVVTYIQSGNVVFDSVENDPAKIVKMIGAGMMQSFGIYVQVILRDRSRLKRILENNPFINQRKSDPENLYITFLSALPVKIALRSFSAAGDGGVSKANSPNPTVVKPTSPFTAKLHYSANDHDEFMLYDKEIYVLCPNGYGKTKFSNTFFEKKLGVSATTRNWRTVNALYEILQRR